MKFLEIKSAKRDEMIEITDKVAALVADAAIKGDGICVLFTQHTTCGLTVNENADADVKSDMIELLAELIPQYHRQFRHSEQNSDAHIKTSLIGTSVSVPVAGGELVLGRWQGIFLCEFDGPRTRKVAIVVR